LDGNMAGPTTIRNTNALWGAVGVGTFESLGLKHVVISPGSRSTPLASAFAESKKITSHVILDERSAGFFALGIAKASREPVALLCTSGTAVANYLPAVIEARLSSTPLIVLSADRPPELRDCHSGQTITQNNIFGVYPVWTTEVAVPSSELNLLRYWRQTLVDAWQRAQGPIAGPVHLNLPFRDPLHPGEKEDGLKLPKSFVLKTFTTLPHTLSITPNLLPESLVTILPKTERGVIIVGPHAFVEREEYTQALLQLAQLTGWPLLVDGAGTMRGDLAKSNHLVSAYDHVLRNPSAAKQIRAEYAVIIGPLPTSKVLRQWLKTTDLPAIQLNRPSDNTDMTHSRWTRLDGILHPSAKNFKSKQSKYLSLWNKFEKQSVSKLQKIVDVDWAFEGKVVSLIDEALGSDDCLFIGSSMPIRDLEWFYHPAGPGPEILSNRGANGIDGTVSTALGASIEGKRTVLVCGDLTFLHDSNALLTATGHTGDLTILVINNQGGGIFNHLAVAEKNPYFEKLWATPQIADISKLCAAHLVRHHSANTWAELRKLLEVRGRGVRVIEFWTEREKNADYRLKSFGSRK
jgi:2-succinyl-5-enolpyruvyl-6-hydroxy-3-cyclohexene-1-carboxylate synthase